MAINSLENAGILLGLLQPPPVQTSTDLGNIVPSVDERFSTLLETILPSFVSEKYPLFVDFMKAYYEWSEQHGNPRAEAVRINTYRDIDTTVDDFVQYFKSEFLFGFDSTVSQVDDEKLVKIIRDLYQEKGNTRSVELLMRLVFNTEAEVQIPKDLVFKTSDSDSITTRVIKTTRVSGVPAIESVVGGKVIQRATTRFSSEVGSALIEDIDISRNDGIQFVTLKVKDVSGFFEPNKDVEFVKGATLLYETCLPQISSINIGKTGENFAINEEVKVEDSSNRLVGSSFIESVGVSGEIESIAPIDSRTILVGRETYSVSVITANGSGASLDVLPGVALSQDRKNFLSDRSLMSSLSRVQDNDRYQAYSYLVKAEKQLDDYASIVKNVLHPAGTKLFAEQLHKFEISATTYDLRVPETVDGTILSIAVPHGIGSYKRGDIINLENRAGAASATLEVLSFTPSDVSLPPPFVRGSVTARLNTGVTIGATKIVGGSGDFKGSVTFDCEYAAITTDTQTIDAKIGNYTPMFFSLTMDYRGDTFGSTFSDYYPTGFNGLTAAILGLYNFSPGTAITHDPFAGGGFTTGPMGGVSAGTQNPEAFGITFSVNAGVTLPGYTVENIDQLVMVEGTDSATSKFWTIYKHPKNLVSSITSDVKTLRRIKFAFDIRSPYVTANTFGAAFPIGGVVTQRDETIQIAIGTVVAREIIERQPISIYAGNTFEEVITIDVLNGEFTNEFTPGGTQIPVVPEGAENDFRIIKGTNGIDYLSDVSVTTDIAMQHINIQDFIENMRNN